MPGITPLPPAVIGLTTGIADRFLPGTGKSRPAGVEAYFEYNGATFNVRTWQDTFLITTIDGMADPDVRDTREVNPGRHGETAFDAYYGGRTIVLTGKMRAGNLNKLRDMQQGLKFIFGDIGKELPLYIRTNTPEKDVFIKCKKSQPIVMSETQQNFGYTRDFQITLRASDPFFLSYMEQRLVQSYATTLEEFSVPVAYDGPINISENPDASQVEGALGSQALGFYTRQQLGTFKYASPSGSDTTGTGTLAAPYLTVQTLFNQLAPGEVGVLRGGTYGPPSGGTYVLDVTTSNSGTLTARKKLVAYQNETVIFSGRHTVRNGAGHVDFENIKFLGAANTLFEYYGSGTLFDHCEFNNGNSAASGVLVGSFSNNWAVTHLKFQRCRFQNIGPAGTGALHHAIYFDKTAGLVDLIEGYTVEVSNCVFRECQGGYTIQLYRAPQGIHIHHNVFYNNYRGITISADNPAVAGSRTEDCRIANNIFHTTNAAVSPYGYHISHYMEPPPPAGEYFTNDVAFNILWNPAYDPDNNGGIQVDAGDTQGFDQHGNQEIDPGFAVPASNNFNTSAPAAEDKGLTTVWSDISTFGDYPALPLKVRSFGQEAYFGSSAEHIEMVHRKNDRTRWSCVPGDQVGLRARFVINSDNNASGPQGVDDISAHVYFYDASGNFLWDELIASGLVPDGSGYTWATGLGNAPAGSASFEIVIYAHADLSYTLIPNVYIGIEKILVVVNPSGSTVPKFFQGNQGGIWLGTAGISASQMMSEDGLDEYDIYSPYFNDTEAAPPNVYADSGRLYNKQINSLWRFLRKDAPAAASLAQSITYYTGANVQRSNTSGTDIIIKWIDENNYIFARVNYQPATANVGFYKVVAGSFPTSMGTAAAIPTALVAATGYKLMAQISGNDLSLTHQRQDATQSITSTYTLSGAEITQFGAAVIGRVGFGIAHSPQSMSDWSWDDHTIDLVGVADIVAFVATNEGNTNARPILIVNGALTAAVANGPSLKVTARYIDEHGQAHASSLQINAYGGTVNALPIDHYLEIDTLARTIKEFDSGGDFVRNAYEQLDVTSEWIVLGANGDTTFELQTFTPNRPVLELTYRHTFL